MQLRKIAMRAADAVGYEAYPKYIRDARPLAVRLQHLFARCNIDRVIDIGGNKGQFHDFLRFHVEFGGTVHSFEPDPELADVMRRAAARDDAQWTISQLALGREAGQRTFSRMRNTAYNSFLTPLGWSGRDPENAPSAQFEVEVRRLDDVLPELGDLSRTFIKVDTQGFDLEVLAGGPSAFAQAPLAQTEVSFRPIYEGSPDWIDSIQAFLNAGFLFAGIYLLAGPDEGAPCEADLLVIKPAFA